MTSGETVTFDLTGSITTDGDHCYAITSPSTDSVRYLSRETARGPSVEITLGRSPTTPTTNTTPLFPPVCGDGVVDHPTEDCDGVADAACPGLCLSDCHCAAHLQGIIEADASVKARNPSKNYGTNTELRADFRSAKIAFLRARVSGVGDGTIVQAVLRLRSGSTKHADSDSGGRLHALSDCTWDETALTWATRPIIDGALLGTEGPVAANTTVDFDVTNALTGDGVYCFALDSLSDDGVTYLSREATSGMPELLITYHPVDNGHDAESLACPESSRVAVDGAFKVPGLRNVELTGPYFHNGGQATLHQVVTFYERLGDFSNENLPDIDPDLARIFFTEPEAPPLVEFMLSLTDDRVRDQRKPFDHPQLFVPNGHPGSHSVLDCVETLQACDDLLEIPAVGAKGRSDHGLSPLGTFLDLDPLRP